MSKLKYNLDGSFTTYENVDEPKRNTTLELPLGNINLDPGYYVGNNGRMYVDILPEETKSPRIIMDNNKEYVALSVTTQPIKGNTRVSQAYNFFKNKLEEVLTGKDKDFKSDIGARAIVGNLMFESGDKNLNKTDNIGDRNLGPEKSAYGMGLWRLDRRTALKNFAALRGKPISDFETLLEFVWHEMNGSLKNFKILEGLMNAKSVEEATESFMNTFERPNKNPKINAIAQRIKYAMSI